MLIFENFKMAAQDGRRKSAKIRLQRIFTKIGIQGIYGMLNKMAIFIFDNFKMAAPKMATKNRQKFDFNGLSQDRLGNICAGCRHN